MFCSCLFHIQHIKIYICWSFKSKLLKNGNIAYFPLFLSSDLNAEVVTIFKAEDGFI